MPDGFFSSSELVSKPPLPLLPRCGSCGLWKDCDSPKMPVGGEGRRKVLLVGEAPGEHEDKQNVQFIGLTGTFMRERLEKIGIDMVESCWMHNAIACRSWERNEKGYIVNKTPTNEQVDHCRPLLMKAIKELKPEVIIPLGNPAIQSLIGPLWDESIGGILKWSGFQIPSQEHNAWICPIFHPSYTMRDKREKQELTAVLFFDKYIKAAFELKGRPWKKVPDYKSEIDVIHSDKQAARVIRKMVQRPAPIAFDYETNMLKPDGDKGEIVSCAICWKGKKTIAYPWQGEAIQATRELLMADHPKIASNLKFEERWTRAVLKCRVKNWKWDTMLAAHVIDCRRGITGLKFQAYVLLGFSPYNDHIAPFLKADHANEVNQIRKIGIDDLLIYNGLDALLEYKVAMKQMGVWDHDR